LLVIAIVFRIIPVSQLAQIDRSLPGGYLGTLTSRVSWRLNGDELVSWAGAWGSVDKTTLDHGLDRGAILAVFVAISPVFAARATAAEDLHFGSPAGLVALSDGALDSGVADKRCEDLVTIRGGRAEHCRR